MSRFGNIPPFKRGDRLTNVRGKMETLRRSTQNVAAISGEMGGDEGIAVTMMGRGTGLTAPDRLPGLFPFNVISVFWAILDANSETGSGLFRYAWGEAEFSGDTLALIPNGRTGSISDEKYALNLYEAANTGTIQGGVDVTGSDYPAGFDAKPVGVGGVMVPVIMYEVFNKEGAVKYWFNAATTHDGTCT